MTTPENGDDTVMKTASGPRASRRMGLPGEYTDALPAGTRLHEFEIVSVIGQGGFGIVYLARDLALDRDVAIKEYMPSSLATRTEQMTVEVRSDRHADTFAAGLRSFINEARLLARFDHASLLKVYRFWEAHGTAYMVMPFYEGVTLGKLLAQIGDPPDEAGLRALLEPLLDALAQMHAANCYHRDIAPDNILIQPDGRPLLLDFGAARRVIGGMTQALTVILKTGYAPVEQYGEMPNMSQGAWTDLYALASVVEFAITGRTPPQAVARFLGDKRVPLATVARGRYSESFLQAIDAALAVLPKDRPQTAAEMRALLGLPQKPVRKVDPISRPMPLGSGPAATPEQSLRAQPSAPVASMPVDFELDLGVAAPVPPRTSPPSRPTQAMTTHPPWTSVDTGEPIVTTPGGFEGRLTTQPRESLSADVAAVSAKKKAASGLAGSLIVMGGSLLLLVAIVFAVYYWVSTSPRPYVAPAAGGAPASTTPAAPPPAAAAAPGVGASSISAPASIGTASAASASASSAGATPAAISASSANPVATPTGNPAVDSNSNQVPAQAMPLPASPATPVDTTPATSGPTSDAASPAATEAPALQAPTTKPRKQFDGAAPARAAPVRIAPADPPSTQYTPNKKLLNPRCADIIARVSLGEEPSAADKAILRRDCGQ